MVSCLDTKGCGRGLKSCKVCRTNKEQCQNAMETWSEAETRLQKEKHGSKNWYENPRHSCGRADLDEEIRILQAGEERRGSCASQSNGCCFDPAVVEHFITMGAAQAWQQLAFIEGEVSRVYGGQHQPAPATAVHVSGGGRRRRRT